MKNKENSKKILFQGKKNNLTAIKVLSREEQMKITGGGGGGVCRYPQPGLPTGQC